jgi:hypothetical protein
LLDFPAQVTISPMDPAPDASVKESTKQRFANSRGWYVALAGVLVWQAWVTLTLFGQHEPWKTLLDDRPIVSGWHPLHLYHGYLGARSLKERGTPSCYDPAFQAGYPKTPVFDPGSRPAELFLSLNGGRFRPEVYKIGLAFCCMLAPVFFWTTSRSMGFDRATSCLAAAMASLVCWGTPGREILESGDLDLFLAGLADLATVGFLLKFHKDPGLKPWLGLVLVGSLGWYAQPLVFGSLFPLFLLYYFSAGPRHGLCWHVALFFASVAPLLINSFWLFDWLSYWWIRTPIQLDVPVLSHRTFRTFWNAPQWGSDCDRILAAVLICAAVIGTAGLGIARERLLTRLLAVGLVGSILLVLAGVGFESFGMLSTSRLLVPTLWTASLPAAYAATRGAGVASRCVGGALRCALLLLIFPAGLGLVALSYVRDLDGHFFSTDPLSIGMGAEAQKAIDLIKANTTPDCRILIEETSADDAASHWTALLPILTGRSFIGGLIPDATIEHSFARLVDQNLAGRPMANWSDAELTLFCRHYNIGWVLCRSSQVRARFQKLAGSEGSVLAWGTNDLSLVSLRAMSYFLRGEGRVLRADTRQIALADLVPDDGTVVLSLHYQQGMQALPARVQIEKEPDAQDPVPFIRLRMPGPVARVTLTWNER